MSQILIFLMTAALFVGILTATSAASASPAIVTLTNPDGTTQHLAPDMGSPAVQRYLLLLRLAPIHSHEGLVAYLAGTKLTLSPLHYLDPDARARFLASLSFNTNGLTSFSYQDLLDLTPTQVYQILSLFGVQDMTPSLQGLPIETPTDQQIMESGMITPLIKPIVTDYKCVSRANCYYTLDYGCVWENC